MDRKFEVSISKYYDSALSSALFIESYFETQEDPEKNKHYDEYIKSYSKYVINSNKIRMYLNPAETDHKNLEEIMDKIDSFFKLESVKRIDQANVEIELKKMINISRKIFKI